MAATHDPGDFPELDPKHPRLGSKEEVAKLTDWELMECVLALEEVRTFYFWGPPGVGKTYSALRCGRVEQGVYVVTLTDETSAAELRGHFVFRGGDAVWHDGPFVRAMREGKRLVINEITRANADTLALMMPILESIETAALTLPTGETVRPQPGFHVVATDNQPPHQLPEALDDRFAVYVRVRELHPEALARLHPQLRQIAASSASLEDDRRISARGWLSLQSLAPLFGLLTACKLAFGPDRGPRVFETIVMRNRGKLRRKVRG